MSRKNKALIANMKRIQREIDSVLPCVYAGIALSLHRKHGWGYKRINDLFVLSTEVWAETIEKGISMTEMCLDETGIDVVNIKAK